MVNSDTGIFIGFDDNQIALLAEQFLSIDHLSFNTFKAYKTDLHQLISKFKSLEEFNNYQNLLRFQLELRNNYSQKTVARKWSTYREFLQFCQKKINIKKNYILEIPHEIFVKKPERKLKKEEFLLGKELAQICDSPVNIREKALLWFFYSTGLRVSEYLKYGFLENLNLIDNTFIKPLNNIDGEHKITFLCKKSKELLEKYLKSREHLSLKDYIFLDDNKEPFPDNYAYEVFKKQAQIMNIKASFKDLRDSFVMRLLKNNASMSDISYLLGFKSTKSLEAYLSSLFLK